MTDLHPPVADWLPPALRDAPSDVDDAPRLLDLLLEGVDRQRRLLEDDIDQVWQDLFIESCADWAVPYIATLVGLPPDAGRPEVASAIALRRRKGTPAALEDFAEVITGLVARVIEGWQVTTWVQRLRHPPPPRLASVDFRDASRFRVGTPFDAIRRAVTPSGPHHPRAATVVVWPWEVRTYHAVQAAPLPEAARFALHPLGVEAPPYLNPPPRSPRSGGPLTRTGDELDAPVRVTYRLIQALAAAGQITYNTNWTVAADHPLAAEPEPGRPVLLALEADGTPVPWTALRFGGLPPGGPATSPPAAGDVVVDLARGHVELGSDFSAPLRATWHRPTPGGIGALAGDGDSDPAARVTIVLNPALPAGGRIVHTLADAFTQGEALSAGLDPDASVPEHPDVEIRIETSDRLAAPGAPVSFTPTLKRWRVIAPRGMTPTVDGDVTIDLDACCLTLEGFALAGSLTLGKGLDGVELVDLTLSPLEGNQLQVAPGAWGLTLSARRCVMGAIRADLGAFPITLTDCVVDGTGARLRVCGGDPGGAPSDAVAAGTGFAPAISADGTTFAGAVRAEAADAVDCLFAGGIDVVEPQEGCLRHCFLGPDLTTPPSHPVTYRCGPFPAPTFVSTGFEAAGYYALDLERPHPLLEAASDGGEVGARHHLHRAARLQRLRRRVHEFVPLGVRPGLALAPWEE